MRSRHVEDAAVEAATLLVGGCVRVVVSPPSQRLHVVVVADETAIGLPAYSHKEITERHQRGRSIHVGPQ